MSTVRRTLKAAVFGLLALSAGFMLRASTIPTPNQVLTPIRDPRLVRGAFHVHTSLSDGDATPEEIAAAAKASGTSFVVFSDHNVVDPKGTRFIDGVLALANSEISTRAGHVVALGLSREMTEGERRGDPIAAMRALGAEPIAAHPLNRKRPYDDIDKPGLTGLEVLSADDLFREALASPIPGLVLAALAYPVNPAHALSVLVERPSPTLAKWDELLKKSRITGMCALDAHGLPPYGLEMRALGLYVLMDPVPAGDARAAAAEVKHAVASGRVFFAVDLYGDASGFSFRGHVPGHEASLQMGDEVDLDAAPVLEAALSYAEPPKGAKLRVLCDGQVMAEAAGTSLSFKPQKPCAYRAEALIEARGAVGQREEKSWIWANPIYVR